MTDLGASAVGGGLDGRFDGVQGFVEGGFVLFVMGGLL